MDTENIKTDEKKKPKKILWIVVGIVVVLILTSLTGGKSDSGSGDDVIDKLQMFSTVYQGENEYYFLGNEETWALTYTTGNEFVSFENDTVVRCFGDAFGYDCFAEDSASDFGFAYDISDDMARIYFDVTTEEGYLTLISYNLADKEYTMVYDGETWSTSESFNDFVEEYGLSESIEEDINEFKALLQQYELTTDDLLKVKYDTLDEQFVAEESVQEEINNGTTQKGSDEVSENYVFESFQVDVESVKNEYLNKGFEYVWFYDHEVKAPEDGKKGDIGTTDTINMRVVHVNENGYFRIEENISALYTYWGPYEGWHNNFEGIESGYYSLLGFDNTYWKTTNYDVISSYADAIEDRETRYKFYDLLSGEKPVSAYVKFYNMSSLQRDDNYNVNERKINGFEDIVEMIIVVDGVSCRQVLSPNHEGIEVNYSENGWSLRFLLENDDEYGYTTIVYYSEDSCALEPCSKEEFEKCLQEIDYDMSPAPIIPENCYGLYEKKDEYYTYQADVYKSGDGLDYIHIGVFNPDGDETDGIIEPILDGKDGRYLVSTLYDEFLVFEFTDEGLELTITNSESKRNWAGTYNLISN